MVYDDKRTQIGDYVFERHEGVIMCYPFVNKDDWSVDESKKLEYSPCDMLNDLDECFSSFREQYKKYCPDTIGFSIKLTISDWFRFFELALHESVSLISVNRFHDEDKVYSWLRIQEMITPISGDCINVLNCVGILSDDEFKNYNVGVIESDDEIIITSVIELSLDELDTISAELRDYCLLKLDNSGYIKYYVFKYSEDY